MNHRLLLVLLVLLGLVSCGRASHAQTQNEFTQGQSVDSRARYTQNQNRYPDDINIKPNPLDERDVLIRPQDDFSPSEVRAISRLEGDRLLLDNCVVEFMDEIKLPALESGQIAQLNVREGDPIRPNQLLGKIDDRLLNLQLQQYQKSLEIAEKKANDQSAVLLHDSEVKLKETKYGRLHRLGTTGSKPQSEVEEAKFELEVAILRLDRAKHEQQIARGEAELAKAKIYEVEEHLSRLQLFVDFEGYVIELLKRKLEWVNAGDPILRISRMDRVSVHAIVESAKVNPHQIQKGQRVLVTLKMAGGQTEQFQGQIASIVHTRDTGMFFKIKAEVENRRANEHSEHSWLLQPLSIVSMVVELN